MPGALPAVGLGGARRPADASHAGRDLHRFLSPMTATRGGVHFGHGHPR
jgi:hypothetical protein